MRSICIHIYLLSFLTLFTLAIYSQASFVRVQQPNPLGWGSITGFAQDRQGYLWISTAHALYKFDGYTFTPFIHDPLNPNSIADNLLETVYRDSKDKIWIGFFGGGLDRMDPATGIITHFRHDINNSSSLSGDTVLCILEDKKGAIWVGTTKGLNELDGKTSGFRHFAHSDLDSTSISDDLVNKLYEDHTGSMWVGTGSPFVSKAGDGYAPKSKGGLNRFNPETRTFTRYIHRPEDSTSLFDNKIVAIFEDRNSNFWVGSAGENGLQIMDRSKGTFQHFFYDSTHPEKLSKTPGNHVYPFVEDYITFITEDVAGIIWIGSLEGGLTQYDPVTNKVIRYQNTKANRSGFSENCPYSTYTTRDGVFWVGTWCGALYHCDPFNKLPHFSEGEKVEYILKDKNRITWIGTDNGLIKLDTLGNRKKYMHDPNDTNSLSNNSINAIREGNDGQLWIASYLGIDLFDNKSEKFRHFQHHTNDVNSLINDTVYTILVKEKSVWAGTEKGLDKLDIASGTFSHYVHAENDSNGLAQNFVSMIREDQSNNLWIGNWFLGGINVFNPITNEWRHFLKGGNISSIAIDHQGDVWAGLNSGLYRYTTASGKFSLFSGPETVLKNADVLFILEDHQHNLWVHARKWIIKIDSQRVGINFYAADYGVNLIGDGFFQHDTGAGGEISFPDGTGYFSFLPEEVKSNVTVPQIIMTEFRLNDSVVHAQSQLLKTPLNDTKEISLDYDQNNFSFRFVPIHFSDPENNKVIFKLENFDISWHNTGTDGTANYYKVPPGKYVFRVKASSSNGFWSEKDVTIFIAIPYYQTWWFLAVCFIALAATFYIAYDYRRRTRKHVATVRRRIASDLHDEIGSTLNSISVYSEVAQQQLKNDNNQVKQLLEKMGSTSRTMIDTMNDIVWAINPKNDDFENILQRMQYFAAELLSAKNMLLQFSADENVKKIKLPMDKRKNFYLIYKEAIHNAYKYSSSFTVSVSIVEQDNTLIMIIADNGKGFDFARNNLGGNGIKNMEIRAKEIGAKIEISSWPGKGTRISLKMKV